MNLKVEGEYPLYYTAVDSSGNETTVEVTVTVKQQSVTKENWKSLLMKYWPKSQQRI